MPNARHQPPRIQRRYGQVARIKATLFAFGCMVWLGGALKGQIYDPKIPKISHLPCLSANLFSSIE